MLLPCTQKLHSTASNEQHPRFAVLALQVLLDDKHATTSAYDEASVVSPDDKHAAVLARQVLHCATLGCAQTCYDVP